MSSYVIPERRRTIISYRKISRNLRRVILDMRLDYAILRQMIRVGMVKNSSFAANVTGRGGDDND